ncbi:MAG: O-antigen ligase family protein [Chloroflexi bacterium]|nr:O-antigen ligase family protein [Chloroflexota bacterium]
MLLVLAGVATLGLNTLLTRGITYGPPAVANIPANRYGIDTELDKIVQPADLQRSIDMISAAGFGWVRQTFDWDELEISAKGDFFDHKNNKSAWEKYDAIVDAANARDLQVIARLERPPDWARPGGSQATAPPSNYADYGDFVAAFVQHFKGRVHYVQIWNEPNRFEDWGYQPVDPAAYTRLLKIGYERAKEADPSITVLSAALTPTTDCCTKNRPDPLYLQQMYDAGARGSFDILGAQAYGLRAGPEDPTDDLPLHLNAARKAVIDSHNTNFGRVVLDRQVMVRNGDAGKPVWVSEFGWNALPQSWTGDPSPWGSVSLDQQAAYTVQALARAQREWPWLGVMNLWLFQDPSPAPRDPTQFFGIVDTKFQPRPVYDQLAALMHLALSSPPGTYAATRAFFTQTWQPAASSLARISPISGATAMFQFSGQAVFLQTLRGPGFGIAYAAVDGSPTYATDVAKDSAGRAQLDLYAPATRSELVPIASGLPYGVHTLTLTVSGLANPASRGPAVEVDGFQVGLTRDQRPVYAGAVLIGLGLLTLLFLSLSRLRWRLAEGVATVRRLLPASWGPYLASPTAPGEAPVPIALTLIGFAILYFGRPWPVTVFAALLTFGAALLWLDFVLVAVPLAAPFYLQPVHIRGAALPLTEILIGVCAAAYLVRTAVSREWRWPRTPFGWPALLFAAAGTASVFAAEFSRYALREWRTDVVEPLVLFGLIVLVRPRVRWMVDALLAGGAVVALAGIVQYARHRGVAAEGVLRMVAVYYSPDNFALYLGRLAPIAAATALLAPLTKAKRALYTGAGAVCLVGVLLSFTRGAWLGDAAALLVVAAFAGRNWLTAAVGAGALAGVGLASVQAKRIQSIFTFTPGSTGFSRLELWRATAAMIRDHPLFGVGLDNFLYQYPHYILPEARNEPDLSHPHNWLLDFWSRIGVFGLAAFVWLEVLFFRMALKVARLSGGWERALAVGLLASMVDALVHGLVDNAYFLIDLSLLFWLTLGLMQLLEFGSPDP